MNKFIGIIVIAAVVIIGGYFFLTKSQSENQPAEAAPEATVEPTKQEVSKSYTLEEVAQHAKKEDCWLAIEGKVYNVTEFIAGGKHPGKDAIIQGCGKNATELFNTRPMGSNTPHSEKARSFLPNFYIGDLK